MLLKQLLSATALSGLIISTLTSGAVAAAEEKDDLLNLSLEELVNVEVTSVSKKSEKASEAAAAIFVITQDDIKRMGATSIPEALRVVPGLNVARAGAHQWAITSRGFNDQFANKLLVLIDGRSVYTPLFSGVYWDVQDTLLEDIDRIEVIRGPGSTLWGANAVNGVINIITKKSKDTQGTLLSQLSGNQEHSITSMRHGAKLSEDAYLRAYVKNTSINNESLATGGSADDDLHKTQAGFRSDWKSSVVGGDFTLQGDIYNLSEGLPVNLPSFVSPPSVFSNIDQSASGGNILGRWNYSISSTSEFTTQLYYDSAKRRVPNAFDYTVQTFDVDMQHSMQLGERNEVIWGAGYRLIKDDSEAMPYFVFTPDDRTDAIFSAFAQDKIMLSPKELYLTLGSKFEHNDYTGFEVQPNARLTWLVEDNQTVWASVTRAVRTPSRSVDDGNFPLIAFPPGPAPVGFLSRVGDTSHDSEDLIAYEVGYRIQPLQNLSIDATAFYNDYSNLIRGNLGAPALSTNPFWPPHLVFPVLPINDNGAEALGFEASVVWNVQNNWQLSANYSYLDLSFDKADFGGFSFAGKSPKHQFNVRSNWDITDDLQLNNVLYYTDDLTGIGVSDYVRFDTQISWEPWKGLELSLVGQNLFDERHQEFSGFIYQTPAEIGRSVYGKVTWQF